MSLEEAISHCEEVINSCTNESCKLDHEELLSYLTELKTKRSQIDNTLRFRVNANEVRCTSCGCIKDITDSSDW